MTKIFFLIFLLMLFFSNILDAKRPSFLLDNNVRIDSLIKTMSLEEKIGQLIMVTSISGNNGKDQNIEKVLDFIGKNRVGGVLFLKSDPYQLATLTNLYQDKSKIPLFIAIDGENGLSFRIDSIVQYPYLIGLGAIPDDSLLYRMGREIGQQCRTLGINVNFAPVGDVNSNPDNPVINYRSFGQDPNVVARKSWQLAKGMQEENIIVSLKHFPGHGNTSFDSHHMLPEIDRDYSCLDSVDFLPFKACIDSGITGIMSAHIYLSKIDQKKIPATLSKKVMTSILRDTLGFEGLIFSDGMNMKGITSLYSEGEAAVEALKAGVDVIEFVLNPEKVIVSIKEAIEKGELSEKDINRKCYKVLSAKLWAGVLDVKPVEIRDLNMRLNKLEYQLTSRLLSEKSITVIKNQNSLIPLKKLDTLKIASLSIGCDTITYFQRGLERYSNIDHFFIGKEAKDERIDQIISVLKNYNLVIVGVHGTKMLPSKRYGITDCQISSVKNVCANFNSVIVYFGNPYSLNYLRDQENENAKVEILTYSESKYSQDIASQLIFGAIGSKGRLPVSVNEKLGFSYGIDVESIGRYKFSLPEEVKINSLVLQRNIDSLVNIGLSAKAFPGCQVFVAKENKVIFHKCYGFHSYEDSTMVKEDDIYDWASITKISGPLPLVMKFYENSILNLDDPFSNYWPDFKNSNKSDFTLREALAHQARLLPWIPFYAEPLEKTRRHNMKVFSARPSGNYTIRISSQLYMLNDYKNDIFKRIRDSKLLASNKYSYSDLCFIVLPEVISNLSGISYEELLREEFIEPLGISTVCYNPYRFYPRNKIIPTEHDDYFRKELICGFVHDESAAMLGGISGNAGLFGTTRDLAVIMQFYLNGGLYGDFNYLSSETLKEFTKIQYPTNENRRGLGFDKPYIDNHKRSIENAYPAISASKESFGHTGFTGTFAWADPVNKLIVIIMTNRVYPTRENNKLTKMNLRPLIHQAVYDSQNTFSY